MHFLPQLSDFVPLENAFYSFRAQTDQYHPVDPGTSVAPRGVASTARLWWNAIFTHVAICLSIDATAGTRYQPGVDVCAVGSPLFTAAWLY